MDEATSKLCRILNVLVSELIIDDYEILEDSQSLADVEDGKDFMFKHNNKWSTASARINYSPGNYISMRASRITGKPTELYKKLRAYNAGEELPEFMFQFQMRHNKLVGLYFAKTKHWIDYYKNNDCSAFMKTIVNATFCNIPVVNLGKKSKTVEIRKALSGIYIEPEGKAK